MVKKHKDKSKKHILHICAYIYIGSEIKVTKISKLLNKRLKNTMLEFVKNCNI